MVLLLHHGGYMSKVKGYPLIDCFRIIAAILVVTIHTSPLDTISPTLDFYLTRGLGRIAVPFFFITTAYFYFLNPSKKRLYKIIKQTLLIYLAAIIIYLPLNLYNHYFNQSNLTLFIWIGKLLAVKQFNFSLRIIVISTILAISLMFIEISLLKGYQDAADYVFVRHDSMNILLPVVMFWLYQGLLRISGKRISKCKDLSLAIYLFIP